MTASEPTTCEACPVNSGDPTRYWPLQAHHALIRALEDERDRFADEAHTLRKERDGLRALLKEWSDAYTMGNQIHLMRWRLEFEEKVRAAIDGEGKKA